MSGFGTVTRTGGETVDEMVRRAPGSLKVAQAGNPEWYWYGVGRSFMNYNTRQTLEKAVEWFNKAVTHGEQVGAPIPSVGTTNTLQMAYLCRARAKLALKDYAGAKADAQKVPAGFVAYATRSGAERERWNHFYEFLSANRYGTIAPEYRDMKVDGQADPRAMRAAGVSEHDLEQAIRQTGRTELSRVRLAYLERDGSISVIPAEPEPGILDVDVEDGVQTVRLRIQ